MWYSAEFWLDGFLEKNQQKEGDCQGGEKT